MKTLFENPTNEFRAKPFWAWNGKLEKEEILRQVELIEQMGFGGYFMHSRVGLVTEYLGEEWFELINACADEGAKRGLEAWLYDEDRWPSGSAGGMVTEKKENRMQFMVMHVDGFEWKEGLISAYSCRLDGVNVFDLKKLNPGETAEGTIIWFDTKEFKAGPNYNGNTYLDTMKRSATEDYIKSTHEKYKEKCGNRLGSAIPGVFTDEPHRGTLMCDTENEGENTANFAPYTDALFEEFQNMWGYDLAEKLPELFLRVNGEVVSPVKWHYCELTQQLFLNHFIKPIMEWCEKNHMHFTGHVLHEDTLGAQVVPNGSMMRNYEWMDYPGVDVLGQGNNYYNIAKQISSVARQCGKKWLLSELYGCTGWQMNFENYKNAGDWQALLGINLRCPHLSWYTMAGEAKRDYPASIFFQSAWYREYKYVEDYYARIGVFFSEGVPLCDTLVINPVESLWCQIYAGWAHWLGASSEEALKVEKQFEELYHWLLSENIDFDYADEEMLSRLYRIENDTLMVGQAAYKKVVVSGMLTMRSSTLDILQKFQQAGGKVVVLGETPKYIDAEPAQVQLGNAAKQELLSNRAVVVDHPAVFAQARELPNGDVHIMLLNSDKDHPAQGAVHFDRDGYFESWSAREGTVTPIAKPQSVSLAPGQEMLLVLTQTENTPAAEEQLEELKLGEVSEVRLDEPNVLVVDRVTCTVDGEEISGDVLKVDRQLRKRFGLVCRGGGMYQPWFAAKQGLHEFGEITLTYQFHSEIDTEAELVVEQADRCEVACNGEILEKSCGKWIDSCFDKFKVSIKKGNNTVTMKTVFREDTDLEAIYLLGNFGVEDWKIVPMAARIGYGDLKDYGLPLYSGKITYVFNQKVEKRSLLRFDSLYGAACLKVNGKIIAWKPYETVVEPADKIEVELVLTRRNTFGPLHELPAVVPSYGPENFIREGSSWSDEFVTLPCGLTRD